MIGTAIMAAFGALLAAAAFLPGTRSRAACFLRALGLQAIVAIPVGVAQAIWVIEGVEFPALFTVPLVAAPFNTGGLLCAAAFESIHRAGLLAHRQTTVLDNLAVYYPLLAAQAGIVAGYIGARTRLTGRILADRGVLVALAFALANSVLGMTWPWWGS
ncbi:MAG TPA: hypothetical protein VFF69_05730 [Phycisphaerales bacterium]|nr:hypothetical protein [Phycisphaerales bacterium]